MPFLLSFIFFLIFLFLAVIPIGDTNSRYLHDDFPYVLLTMLKMQIDVRNHKKAAVCCRMDTKSHNFQVSECAVCQVWMSRLCKGSRGAPRQPWLQWECWRLHRGTAALQLPTQAWHSSSFCLCSKCLSTAGLPYVIQRPTATKTLKMRSWPKFCSLLRWKDSAGQQSPEKFFMLFTVLLHDYLAGNSSYRAEYIHSCSPPK